LKCGTYSTGVLWMTIDNLPRHLRYLRENTFLLMAIPNELTTEQLNELLEPIVQELHELEDGICSFLFLLFSSS
jgi:hypothetical protein